MRHAFCLGRSDRLVCPHCYICKLHSCWRLVAVSCFARQKNTGFWRRAHGQGHDSCFHAANSDGPADRICFLYLGLSAAHSCSCLSDTRGISGHSPTIGRFLAALINSLPCQTSRSLPFFFLTQCRLSFARTTRCSAAAPCRRDPACRPRLLTSSST